MVVSQDQTTPVLQLLVQLQKVPVSPVHGVLVLGHAVQADAGVDAVGDVAEQAFTHLLRVAAGNSHNLIYSEENSSIGSQYACH